MPCCNFVKKSVHYLCAFGIISYNVHEIQEKSTATYPCFPVYSNYVAFVYNNTVSTTKMFAVFLI